MPERDTLLKAIEAQKKMLEASRKAGKEAQALREEREREAQRRTSQ
jgi:hypothetical protein